MFVPHGGDGSVDRAEACLSTPSRIVDRSEDDQCSSNPQRPLAPGIHEMLASNTVSNTLLLVRQESELLRTTRFQHDRASTSQRIMRTRADRQRHSKRYGHETDAAHIKTLGKMDGRRDAVHGRASHRLGGPMRDRVRVVSKRVTPACIHHHGCANTRDGPIGLAIEIVTWLPSAPTIFSATSDVRL